ncbi:MAG: dicarboxylate/amino acid:cation symporter [Firmicutes bacterium]|nr:dicarboxylate/amino acid:cation symporter [Bacillota bacterium]
MKLATKIFVGLISGVILGLILSAAGATAIADNIIQPFGDLFIRLIKMLIVPLVFATLVVGASSVSDVSKLSRIGGKTVGYYLCTTAIAITIGVILANIFAPGVGLSISTDLTYQAKETPGIVDTILNIVPTNPIQALADGNMLQIIIFSLFIGICMNLVGRKSEPVKNFFDGFAEIMYKVTEIIMSLAPYGVFALIVPVVTSHGPAVLLPLVKVILLMYVGAIIHSLIVYGTATKLIAKMNPVKFFKGVMPATLVGFSTCSSSGTLPVTIRSTQDNLDVSEEVSSFVLPLGATINMDGAALYQGIAALFVAQVYGIDLTVLQQFTVVLTGALASIGSAGVPGAGLIILTMVLQSVGLPLEGIALVAGVDRILDMARTATNVTGDASCAVVVDATEKRREEALA